MADDTSSEIQRAISFAQTDLFEHRRERSQLRLWALSILGAAVPISISMISLFEGPPHHSAEFIAAAAIALMVLSFVYALFSPIHVNSSGRHDQIVEFLSKSAPNLEDYFTGLNPPPSTGARSFVRMLYDNAWMLCNGMIFVAPCPTALMFSYLLIAWSSQVAGDPDWIVWISAFWWMFLVVNAILFSVVFYQWNFNRRNQGKLTPWSWLKATFDF